jgi:proline dehydrogenase
VFRRAVLGVANRKLLRRAVTGGAGRRVALRFVAGEDLEDAVAVTRSLNEAGATVSLDYLGENVAERVQAEAATDTYRRTLDRVDEESLDAGVSVKLTQIGLDLDPELAHRNAEAVVARAARAGRAVTLDMEDHRYTERTVEECLRLAEAHPGHAGIAIQAYLRRTPEDLERLARPGVQIRLCKGAYKEPDDVALQRRSDVDKAFAHLTERLMRSPAYAMVATHDERLIRHALRQAEAAARAPESFEIQMLYGVRRELQRRLIAEGRRLRVYVPFGTHWYPYLMRRLAERPANLRFFLESLARG